MKLQEASKKELTRIALGTLGLAAALVLVLFLLSLVGVGTFSLGRVLLSAALGCAVAIGNFYALCLTIQKAVEIPDQKRMKMKFQVSYNFRLLAQGIWVVLALLLPQIHVVAGAVPLLFPHMIILTMGRQGKIVPAAEMAKPSEPAEAPQEDSEN